MVALEGAGVLPVEAEVGLCESLVLSCAEDMAAPNHNPMVLQYEWIVLQVGAWFCAAFRAMQAGWWLLLLAALGSANGASWLLIGQRLRRLLSALEGYGGEGLGF